MKRTATRAPKARDTRKDEFELLAKVFPIVNSKNVTMRCSCISKLDGSPPPTVRSYVHSAEVLAIPEIANALIPHGIFLDCRQLFGTPTGTENLILIGSHANNSVANNYLTDTSPFQYLRVPGGHASIVLNRNGNSETFGCEHQEVDKHGLHVSRDRGLIVRRKRNNGDFGVLVFAGIHMHGTLAAVQVALRKEFQEFVASQSATTFVQLVTVEMTSPADLTVPEDGITWSKDHFFPLPS